MKRYDFNITKVDYGNGAVEITEDENSCGEFVKHDQAHALLKEAYEAIEDSYKFMKRLPDEWFSEQVFAMLEKEHIKAEQWLKESV